MKKDLRSKVFEEFIDRCNEEKVPYGINADTQAIFDAVCIGNGVGAPKVFRFDIGSVYVRAESHQDAYAQLMEAVNDGRFQNCEIDDEYQGRCLGEIDPSDPWVMKLLGE